MIKAIKFFSIAAVSIFTFFSCINLDTEKENLSDAFICSKIINGDTVYVLEGFVQSNYTMKSVILKNPDKSLSFDLSRASYSGGYFERVVKNEDFTPQIPATGNYSFEIVYDDGTTVEATDYLSADILKPVEIKDVTPVPDNQSIVVDWVKNTKSDYYNVRILSKDSIIFLSDLIDSAYSSIKIFAYSYGWNSNISPEAGDSLQVVVTGILSEIGNSKYMEVQSVSFSLPVGVVWPE
jgi:hypothetical protein